MLDIASQRKIYKHFYVELLHPGKAVEQLPSKHYDVVVGAGVIAPGHLNSDHLEAMTQPLKAREPYLLGGLQYSLSTGVKQCRCLELWFTVVFVGTVKNRLGFL